MSEAQSRQDRMRVLMRRRQGNDRRERLTRLLEESAPSGWTVLAPPDSDPLADAVAAGVRAAREDGRLALVDGLPAADFPAAVARILGDRPADAPAHLAVTDVAEVGVVRATVAVVRACALAILDQDRDSLVVAGPDASWGLVCQRFEAGTRVTYQIESWRP